MNIGVLGTGMVGQTISVKLAELGHSVMLGTRDVATLLARPAGGFGQTESFAEWHQRYPTIILGNYAEVAQHGALLWNCTNGAGSVEALKLAGEAALNGKILIDIANPLDFSQGMPPTLFISNTDSLAEQLQRTFPTLKVVKTLNTMTAALMVNPRQLANGDHSVFLSGNDTDAKAQVATFLRDNFGWSDIIDLGDITTARGAEMLLPLWLRLWGALGTANLNFKIVR